MCQIVIWFKFLIDRAKIIIILSIKYKQLSFSCQKFMKNMQKDQ